MSLIKRPILKRLVSFKVKIDLVILTLGHASSITSLTNIDWGYGHPVDNWQYLGIYDESVYYVSDPSIALSCDSIDSLDGQYADCITCVPEFHDLTCANRSKGPISAFSFV
jgi:hypothetical protein